MFKIHPDKFENRLPIEGYVVVFVIVKNKFLKNAKIYKIKKKKWVDFDSVLYYK